MGLLVWGGTSFLPFMSILLGGGQIFPCQVLGFDPIDQFYCAQFASFTMAAVKFPPKKLGLLSPVFFPASYFKVDNCCRK